MKYSLLFVISIFSFDNSNLNLVSEELIESEAKIFCKCYKLLESEIKKVEHKVKKIEAKQKRTDAKNQSGRLFGGEAFDIKMEFDIDDCMKNKRTDKENDSIDNLDDETRDQFRERVKKKIKKRCSAKAADLYS